MNSKKLFLTLVLISASALVLNAQQVDYLQIKNLNFKEFESAERYKFPKYIRSQAYLKDGEVASANFNYDYFSGIMRYISGNDTLSIANPEDLKYVVMGTDSFFWDKKYFEWVASTSKTRIYKTTDFIYKGADAAGAYGTSTRNFSVNSVDIITDNAMKGLDLNTILNIEKVTTYYIGHRNGKIIKATKSNIEDMYPKKDVDGFIKDRKINLNKAEDLVALFAYVNSSEK